ncbi:MAG: PCMD domain-containing protein [Bacteroidales bacterium]|nr:PCMD domain-containing protein [Bacteroidales bacterium]
MKAYKYILAASLVAASLSSCSDEKNALVGEGSIMISASINSDLKTASRTSSDDLAAELSDSFEFWLTSENDGGVIRLYNGLDNLPSSLTLNAGHYVAEAWAGDSISASFTDRWFKAYVPFDVNAGEVTTVNVECKIANVVVSVEYGDGVLDAYDVDSLFVCHKRGQLSFKPGGETRGYFMMPSYDKNPTWICMCHRKSDGAERQFNGVLQNVKSAYEYKFNIVFTANDPDDTHVGGAFFDIEVDTTEEPVYDTVEFLAAPRIDGVKDGEKFDLTEVYSSNEEPGELGAYITTTSEIKSVVLECEDFPTILGIQGTSFDPIKITSTTLINTINNGGITWTRTATTDSYNMMLTFSAAFTEALSWETEHSINITVTDANGLTNTESLTILKTAAPITIPDPVLATADAPITLTTNSYVVEGDILNDDGSDIVVSYAESSSRSRAGISTVTATKNGSTYSAQLTGLTPDTAYEFYVTMGSYTSPVSSFVTEAELQFPNNSFENWQTSSSPYLIYGSSDEMFWDSGNHGSATMSKNVTVPSTDYVHSGTYSISLQSQFVGISIIGKFAAGNVFVGKYLATDGTDGVLGWGRAFTGRPAKLHGYVRYEPAEVSYESSSFDDLKKGDTDQGIIYWALLDDYTETYDGEAWPVIIKTKSSDRQLFDKTSSHMIAYGEQVFTEATSGDGLVEFTIPLDYYRTDIRPTYIMCTAAASRGGDYFVGGSSVMYLDDLELIYE